MRWSTHCAALLIGASMTVAQPCATAQGEDAQETPDPSAKSIEFAVDFLLSRQEGENSAEWPYQGVYRVNGQIPIGYRVGGTSIAALAILRSTDEPSDLGSKHRAAVARAAEFILDCTSHPLMMAEQPRRYDVRGWGYVYALPFLLEVKELQHTIDVSPERLNEAITFYLEGLSTIQLASGGWNYSPPRTSTFMTAAALQALFEARAAGLDVLQESIDRALDTLESSRLSTGAVAYASGSSRDAVPGSIGRMLVTESTLYLAGRSDLSRVRGSLDAFFMHWEWLNKRRAQTGTHARPYGVAPYYFYFAHYYAAQAIEFLPRRDRAEYRRRLLEVVNSVRQENGSWNDRVFERSAAYGTSIVLSILRMPHWPEPAHWQSPDEALKPK